MSRLSFRPRPLDIHKKLPIIKNFQDFQDDETPSSTRTHFFRLAIEPDIEVPCMFLHGYVCFYCIYVIMFVFVLVECVICLFFTYE